MTLRIIIARIVEIQWNNNFVGFLPHYKKIYIIKLNICDYQMQAISPSTLKLEKLAKVVVHQN